MDIPYDVSASNTVAVLKVNRMMEVAFENDLPLISLVQSVFQPKTTIDIVNRTNMHRPECFSPSSSASSTKEASSFETWRCARSMGSHLVPSSLGHPLQEVHTILHSQTTPSS